MSFIFPMMEGTREEGTATQIIVIKSLLVLQLLNIFKYSLQYVIKSVIFNEWDAPRLVYPREDSPDPQKGTIPSNYWPMTCLCTTWKLLLGIIAAKMNRHMA